MPRIASGTKDQITGTTGKIQVIADRVADKTLEATEWRPEAVRVVLKLKTDPEKEVSWAVPIESPDLRPYSTQVPQGEPALRRALAALDTSVRWVDVYNNFVKYFCAPLGKHIGTLQDFRLFTRKRDGALRCSFSLITKNGLVSEFTSPWPNIECRKGDAPAEDWMGPEKELNEGTGPFPYLCVLGLDWKRWTDIDLEQAPALWDGHFDTDLAPITPYFASMDDLTPEIFAAVKHHGLKPVQWEVVPHDDYVLSITRGQFFFELTPVIVEGSVEDKAFQDERDVFYEMWDNLTKVVYGSQNRFAFGTGKPTGEGAQIVRGYIVPAVRQKPEIVHYFVEGEPKAKFPVEQEHWRTNGLVFLDLMAERLMKLDSLPPCDPDDTGPFLDWLGENMAKELKDDLTVDEGEEF